MGTPWIIHGWSMDIHGLSIADPWISIGNHGYQGILFVTKWHAIQVERISTIPISMIFLCTSLRVSRFPALHFPFPRIRSMLNLNCGRNRWPLMISLDAVVVTMDYFGGIPRSSGFSRNPIIMTNPFVKCFSWKLSTNSWESMWKRCPVISQPSIYSKSMPFLGFSCLGSRWEI